MELRLTHVGAFFGGTISLAACAAIAGVGCGGDDASTSITTDGSIEATTEAGSDGSAEAEPQEGSSGGGDSSPDDVQEPGSEAGVADADAGGGPIMDASDASDANSANEASAPVYDGSLIDYPIQVSNAFCTAKQTCCLVSPASWNQVSCVKELELGGGFRSLSTYTHSLDGGHVELDASAAETCISDMETLLTAACGTVTSENVLRLQTECYGALVGTLGVDAGTCTSSIECANGAYCTSHGVCAPLQGLGGPCSSTDSCAYRGSSDAGIYCRLAADGGPGQCAQTEGLDGGDCANAVNANDVCSSGLCGFEPGCADSVTFTDPGPHSFYCTFIIPDAGPDGGDGG